IVHSGCVSSLVTSAVSCRDGGHMNVWSGLKYRLEGLSSLFAAALAASAFLALMSTEALKAAPSTQPSAGFYQQRNLVSDQPGVALLTDTNLVNPWGIALNPNGAAFWISNNGTGTSTLFLGDVNGSPFTKVNTLTVTVPGRFNPGSVFNSPPDFVVKSGAASGAAAFLWASQVGVISGWNAGVPPPPPSHNA